MKKIDNENENAKTAELVTQRKCQHTIPRLRVLCPYGIESVTTVDDIQADHQHVFVSRFGIPCLFMFTGKTKTKTKKYCKTKTKLKLKNNWKTKTKTKKIDQNENYTVPQLQHSMGLGQIMKSFLHASAHLSVCLSVHNLTVSFLDWFHEKWHRGKKPKKVRTSSLAGLYCTTLPYYVPKTAPKGV